MRQPPPKLSRAQEGEAELAALAEMAAGLVYSPGDGVLNSPPDEAEPRRADGMDDSAGGEGELPPGIAI